MNWRDAARTVLTIGSLVLLLPLQAGAGCGEISYETGGEGGGCESAALIAAAIVGGVMVAVTAGVVAYRFFTAAKTITDSSAGLATHLPTAGGPRTPGGPAGHRTPAPGVIQELRTPPHELRDGEPVADDALQRASKKRGAGPVQLYNIDSVREIAAKYGIDISEMRFVFAPVKFRGRQGNTFPNGVTRLFAPAFRSEEDLARTLVHERYHLHDIKAGKPFPRNDAELDLWEDRAYAHEQEWWDNQPIRPEPRGR